MKGFFPSSTLLQTRVSLPIAPLCGACGLYKGCKSPKMPYSGQGRRGVLIVAEAPGATEDEKGTQLCGKAGQRLEGALRRIGVDMRRDCYLTNAIICRPPGNETPDDRKIEYCRPNLFNTIKELGPDIIIPLGGVALKSLLGHVWKEEVGAISQWVGFQIPNRKPNCWIAPNYHPSYLLQCNNPVLDKLFERYLEQAFAKEGKPWEEVPDYSKNLICEVNAGPAASAIHTMGMVAVEDNRMLVFDYETNMLKPDGADAEIVCCSISDGIWSLAFPWAGEVIEAMDRLTRLPIKMAGTNIKFEERWTRKAFGHGVRGFKNGWDTMLAAHWLDCRPGICSIKFQAFVMLGQPIWNQHLEQYLKAKGPSSPNRVREIDPHDLLKYCALDSLVEYKVAIKQMEYLHAISRSAE